MEKLCIFCGERPESKNMEHVLPQWLIKETGNPKRIVSLGVNLRNLKLRKFSFDQLKFPACSNCNNNFSKLEEKAKDVVIDILEERALNASAMDLFLTWLDKVRIGLWLGYRYLDKDFYGIEPKFHINTRIRNKERMVLIYKTYDNQKGLNSTAVNTPFFAYSPTCFGLLINKFYFINLSTDFLIARRLGLPFPTKKALDQQERIFLNMQKGLERIIMPLIRISYDKSCTEIYQPIIPEEIKHWLNFNAYKTAHAKKFFKSSRIGKVLIKVSGKHIIEFPTKKSSIWIPKIEHSRHEAEYIATKTVLILQNYLLSDWPSFDGIENEEKRKSLKKGFSRIIQVNNLLLRQVEKELKPPPKRLT